MPIRITLRSTVEFSPYRELLSRLIESPAGDSVLLCSGYIQTLGRYNILRDGLLGSIKKGCGAGKVITVAGSFEDENRSKYAPNREPNPYWLDSYKNFIRNLRGAKVSVEPYIAPERNWHAKIAIRLRDDEPVAALIGSSNLTRPAYSLNADKWNFEGDVMIWSDPALNEHFRRPFNANLTYGDMQLILDPGVRQPDERYQLRALYKDIMGGQLNYFEFE